MNKNNGKNIITALLIVIIIIMAIFIGLLLTGKINLNTNNSTTITNNDNNNSDNSDNKENENDSNEAENKTTTTYKQKKTISNSELMDIYSNYVKGLGEQSYYGIVDINNDGIYELITKVGTCEADYVFNFYTYDENLYSDTAVKIGSISGGNTVLYKMNDNTLMALYGHMGYESIAYYYIDNDWLIRNPNNMSSREINADEDYTTGDQLIELVEASNSTLLNKYR